MTKEELEKAAGQELIEQRDYCGVDGYYGDYLDNVNAEMLKRFNRLADLENKIADIKANCDLAIEGREVKIKELEQQIEKMKCCYNCSKWNDGECEESPKSKTFFCADFKCDNWEFAND